MHRYFLILPAILMLSACATGGDKQPARPDFAVPLSSVSEEADPVDSPPRSLQAQAVLSKPSVSLEDLLQVADEHSPEIQAASEEIPVSAKLWQTDPLLNSTTECQGEFIRRYNDSSLLTKTKFFSIRKMIPDDDDQSASGAAASAETESRFLRFEQKRREVFGKIHALFIELLYFKQAQALYQQLIQDAREMTRIASLSRRLKPVSEVEAPEAEGELLELELASWRVAWERETYSQRLEALLGGIPVPVDKLSGELLADLPQVDSAGLYSSLEENPKLLAARKEAEAAVCRLNQAREQDDTDIDFRFGISRDLVEGNQSIMGGLSIPLPEFGRTKESPKQNSGDAEYLAQHTTKAVNAVEDNLRAELAAAHSEYLSARQRVAASRDQIVPDAEKSFAQIQEEYQEGKRNLSNLVDARLALIKARLSYLAHLRDCNLAYAKILNLTEESGAENERRSSSSSSTLN